MLRLLISLLVTMLFARPALAQASGQLNIVGTLKVPPYQLIRLKAEGADPKAGLLWRVNPSQNVHRATNPRGVLEFVAPPGSYEVELLVIKSGKDGGVEIEEARATVEIGNPTPPLPIPPSPDKKADPEAATVKLRFGNSGCTATIMAPRRPDGRWDVLTAAHCTGGVGSIGTITLKDGRSTKVTVTARNTTSDISWMVTESADDFPFAHLASADAGANTGIWHMGYGVDKPGNKETGQVVGGPDSNGQLRMSLSVSSGDSGSGIFRTDTGELVAVVCCTSGMGRQAAMWGGSATTAAKLRPGPKLEHPIWQEPEPTVIPLRRDQPLLLPRIFQ